MRLLEAIRRSGAKTRFYQASSSESFAPLLRRKARRRFSAAQPYGRAKVYAHWMTRIYREGYHLYRANGNFVQSREPAAR